MAWIQCWQKARWGEIVMWKNVNENKENSLESIRVYCRLRPVLGVTCKGWWVLRAPAQPPVSQGTQRGAQQLCHCCRGPCTPLAPARHPAPSSASRGHQPGDELLGAGHQHHPTCLVLLCSFGPSLRVCTDCLARKGSISVEAESLSGWNPLLCCTLENCLRAKYCILWEKKKPTQQPDDIKRSLIFLLCL